MERETQAPIFFHAIASRGRPVWDEGPAGLVLDPTGCIPIKADDGGIPLLIEHAPYAVAGRVCIVEAGDGAVNAWGFLHLNRWEGQAVLNAILGGIEWKCSIGVKADGFECDHVARSNNPTVRVNGHNHATPLRRPAEFTLPATRSLWVRW
jgi:hypothetical protein